MSRFKLDRRTVIKGAGTIAIALPWLEIMGRGSKARAQTASVPLKRFVTVYQPGGAVRSGANGDKYTPTGTETAFTLSPVLAPLADYQSRLLVVDGTNLTCGDQSKYGGRAAPGRRGRLADRRHPAGGEQLHPEELAVHRSGSGHSPVDGKALRQPAAGRALGDREVTRQALAHQRDELFGQRPDPAAPGSAGHLQDAVRQLRRHRSGRSGRDRTRRSSPPTAGSRSWTSSTRSTRRWKRSWARTIARGSTSTSREIRSLEQRMMTISMPPPAGMTGVQDAHQGRHDRIQPHQRAQFGG